MRDSVYRCPGQKASTIHGSYRSNGSRQGRGRAGGQRAPTGTRGPQCTGRRDARARLRMRRRGRGAGRGRAGRSAHQLDVVDRLLPELLQCPLGLGLQGEGEALQGLVLALHADLRLHLRAGEQ